MTKIKNKSKNKFYSCKNDRAFKEIFGNESNEDLLKCLLESTLGLKVNKITYLNVEKNVDNINIRRKINDLDLSTDKAEIQIEVNATNLPYIHPRNASYAFNKYAHITRKGEQYDEETIIIQLNLSYGLSTKLKNLYNIYLLQTIKGEPYIKNLFIYEFNMDKYKKIWYDKNTEEIQKNKYIIMLDLNLKELEELFIITDKDWRVKKYMENLKKINEDPRFIEYMSAEEDNQKIENSLKSYAREEGRAEGRAEGVLKTAISMLKKGINIKTTAECTGLSIEELKNLNLNS